MIDWNNYTYFKPEEFNCRCDRCQGALLRSPYPVQGSDRMNPDFIQCLDDLRDHLGVSMTITSGFRCKYHSIEAAKAAPGPHNTGLAADVLLHGSAALRAVCWFCEVYPKAGIGLKQHGPIEGRYVHFDMCAEIEKPNRPWLWSYE